MSKFLKVMIVMLTIAAMAVPAMAEVKLNGYYRIQGTSQSATAPAGDLFKNFDFTNNKDASTRNFLDQRLRLKVSNSLNDNITVVWYGEYDMPWGDKSARTLSGSGGELSADGIGLETKNAYIDFKVPNSTWTVRTGIQGFGLGAYYDGFVTQDDMNGIKAQGMIGQVKLTTGWFKWKEGAWDSSDDVDYYSLAGAYKVNEQFKFGLTADLIKNDSTVAVNGTDAKTDDLYFGAHADYVMGNIGFAGSILFRNASGQDDSTTDGDTFMINLYSKFDLGAGGKLRVHGIYMPADDSANGKDRFAANQTGWELNGDNLMIFGTDVYYNNGSQGAIGVMGSAYQGYGMMGVTVSGSYKLPEASYLKYGAGYFMAADDAPTNRVAKDDSDLGYEVAAQVGKKFAEKYDLSLRGAFAGLGDFYGTNNDDLYKVVAMLNVSF